MTSFAYKPDRPATSTVATEVFLYQPDVLLEVLEELHREQSDEPDEGDDEVGDTGLGDFGDLLLPRLVQRGKVYAHRLDGYWRDLGQPHHYLNAHLELVDRRTDLFDADWPIRTMQPQREPTYAETGAGSRTACSARAAAWPAPWSGACWVQVLSSRRAPRSSRACCSATPSYGAAPVTRAIVDRGCELQDGAVVGRLRTWRSTTRTRSRSSDRTPW